MNIDEQNVSSHRGALQAACDRTVGPMIEIGAGTWSTPLLLEVAAREQRPLVTVEHNPDWSPQPQAGHIVTTSLAEGIATYDHYGVALIDGQANERARAVRLLLPKTDFIVIHDTESLNDYPGLRKVLNRVRFRRDFPMPTTTVVSNLRDFRLSDPAK